MAVKDVPRYWWATIGDGNRWLGVANRYERVEWNADRSGVRCDWQWTSPLHAPRVMPWLGRRLFRKAMESHPFEFAAAPAQSGARDVEVSFVIGHRGRERLPLLLATLRTIAAQRDAAFECIVVEQAEAPECRDALPAWIRYVHTPPPEPEMPYVRGWALNVGARAARGELLVLHDNDLLVPSDYAREHLRHARAGCDVVNLKRFIFYLNREGTERLIRKGGLNADLPLDQILQNALGGGSLVIKRSAFLAIGGFDEEFVGWGGEDNEIWDRAMTLKVYPFGYLPLIHLWHAPQAESKEVQGVGRRSSSLFEARSRIPPQERIAELAAVEFGGVSGPRTRVG